MRQRYPSFKDDNINFYLKMLAQYIKISLGMVTKEQINEERYKKELGIAALVSKQIEETLKKVREKGQHTATISGE